MTEGSPTPGEKRTLCVYVDVDDTLVRTAGTKRIPMPAVIEHIKVLKKQCAIHYCWSSGGAEYAKSTAEELGIINCFAGFLPKPNVLLDDQSFGNWRYFLRVYPSEYSAYNSEKYRQKLND